MLSFIQVEFVHNIKNGGSVMAGTANVKVTEDTVGNRAIFNISCRGKDASGADANAWPTDVKLTISQDGSRWIAMNVECEYNTGGHGERCRASHPEGVDKVGDGVPCPFSRDIFG